jgi:adenylosuccinate synthase
VRLCGITQLAVTKMDVLSGIGPVKVCVGYKLADGRKITHIPSDPEDFASVEPIYEEFQGWGGLGDGSWDKMPKEAREFLQFLRERTGAAIKLVGIGPARDQTIIR